MSKQATALRMSYDDELADEPAAAADPIPPGKRTSTQDNRGRGPHLIESRLAALRDRQLPALRAAIASHDLDAARSAARLVHLLLAQLDTQLASAADADVARLSAARDALRAEAEPVLALAPPAIDADDAVDESNRGAWVQRLASGPAVPGDTHAHAQAGVAGTGGALPHLDAIQASFGAHDVSGIRAHVGGAAASASAAIGAEAYATGNDVAFSSSPSLFVAAHEAAHVVQQRAGVSLLGGVGETGDSYEQHADAVAEKVVRGESAEGLLGGAATGGSQSGVQRSDKKDAYDHKEHVRMILKLAAAFGQLLLDGIAPTDVDMEDLLLVGAMEMSQHLEAAARALAGRADVSGIDAEADLAVGASLGIQRRFSGKQRSRLDMLKRATRILMAQLKKHAGWAAGDADALIDDAANTGLQISDANVKELIGHVLRSAQARVKAGLKEMASNAADEELSLKTLINGVADDLTYGAKLLASANISPKAKLAFTDEVKRTATAVDGVEQWARTAKIAEFDGWSRMVNAETRLCEGVGLDAPERSLRAAGSIDLSDVTPGGENQNSCDVPLPRRDLAMNAIKDKVGSLYDAQSRGVGTAVNALREPSKPKENSHFDEMFEVAVSIILSGVAGAVGSMLSAKMKSALKEYEVPNRVAKELKAVVGEFALTTHQITTMVDATRDAAKEAIKQGAKLALKEMSTQRDAHQSSLASWTAVSLYEAVARAQIGRSKTLGLNDFERLRPQLEQFDLDTLNALNSGLCDAELEASVEAAQNEKALLEWVNFIARLESGAPSGSDRDADLAGAPGRAAGVLRVSLSLDPDSPRTPPRVNKINLPGVGENVQRWLRQPTTDGAKAHARTIGSVPFNKVFVVQFKGATFGPMARLLKHPDRANVNVSEDTADERTGFGLLHLYENGLPYDEDMRLAFALDDSPFDGKSGDKRKLHDAAEHIIADAETQPLDGLKE